MATSTKPRSIRELINYRLQKAVHYATKASYIAYAREFNMTGVEWRLLGNLYMDGPLSLVRLGNETDIQLAQASRTVAGMIERGLVHKMSDEKDGRSVKLSLTTGGKALYRKVFALAAQRHAELLSGLDAREQEALFALLEKLAAQGRAMLEAERER